MMVNNVYGVGSVSYIITYFFMIYDIVKLQIINFTRYHYYTIGIESMSYKL